jgi:hypothetical protein
MTKHVENRLKKIGVPSTYIGITALIVTLICSQLGV